jgi:hypothetical protein
MPTYGLIVIDLTCIYCSLKETDTQSLFSIKVHGPTAYALLFLNDERRFYLFNIPRLFLLLLSDNSQNRHIVNHAKMLEQ